MNQDFRLSAIFLSSMLLTPAAGALPKYQLQMINLPVVTGCNVEQTNPVKPLLNDRGQVVVPANNCAFYWDKGRINLLGYAQADSLITPAAMNNKGQVAFNQATVDVAGGTLSSDAFIWQQGHALNIGALSAAGGLHSTQAIAMNERGQVVGQAKVYDASGKGTNHAFLWQDNQLIDLLAGTDYANYASFATDINDHAQIVLHSDYDHNPVVTKDNLANSVTISKPFHSQEYVRPLVWQRGKVLDLARRSFIYTESYADSGRLFSYNSIDYGNINRLNLVDLFFGEAFQINNAGFILGSLRNYGLNDDGAYFDTVLWQPDQSMQVIQAGLTYAHLFASDVKMNKHKQIIKLIKVDPSGTQHLIAAFDGANFETISTPTGWQMARDYTFIDINDLGQIVYSGLFEVQAKYTFKAFIYQDGQSLDLNDLIVENSSWRVDRIYALNQVGQILVGVARGIIGQNLLGGEHAFALLTPHGQFRSSACHVKGDGRMKKQDLSESVSQCHQRLCKKVSSNGE